MIESPFLKKPKIIENEIGFVIEDGLEVEFNFYDDSQKMAEAMKDIG